MSEKISLDSSVFYVFILYFHDINKGAGFQPGFYYIHLF